MGEGEKFYRPLEKAVELLELKPAFGGDGDEAQNGSLATREKLPWHQVAMVFHLGKEDDVALTNVCVAPGASHQVDAFGSPSGKDDVLRWSFKVTGEPLAGALESGRRSITQFMQSTVNIAIIVLVEV